MAETAQAFRKETTDLAVHGMTCGNCVRHVTEAIQHVPGVSHAAVALDPGRAVVKWKPDAKPDADAVVGAVKQAGYEAIVQQADGHHAHGVSDWYLTLWVGVLCTVPLMIGEWVLGLATHRWFQWLSFALATVVQIIAVRASIAGPGTNSSAAAPTWTPWSPWVRRPLTPTACGSSSLNRVRTFISWKPPLLLP
jgi:copper chaperone